MEYDLTKNEKSLVRWMVEANRRGELNEEFMILWYIGGADIDGYRGSDTPRMEPHNLDHVEEEGLMRCDRSTKTGGTKKNPRVTQSEQETLRRCTLLQSAHMAVKNDFVKPDLQPQQPPVINQTNYFNAAVTQSAIGPHSHVEVTQNLNLDAVRKQIDDEGGAYRDDLHELLNLVEEASRNGEVLERGALARFNEAMQNRAWIMSPVVSLLLSFATQGV